MRVKICGITNAGDAGLAVSAGSDAIGINLVSGPRKVDLGAADQVVSAVGPFVTPVVLVRLEDGKLAKSELAWVNRRRISHLQLYGDVTPEAIRRLVADGFRPIFVFRVRAADFAEEANAWLADCRESPPAAILLDAFDPTKAGGTGEPFPWRWVRAAREAGRLDGWPPVLLAGGLRSENVADAIRETRPYGVDVSSGAESAAGKKDEKQMRAFVAAAKAALIQD